MEALRFQVAKADILIKKLDEGKIKALLEKVLLWCNLSAASFLVQDKAEHELATFKKEVNSFSFYFPCNFSYSVVTFKVGTFDSFISDQLDKFNSISEEARLSIFLYLLGCQHWAQLLSSTFCIQTAPRSSWGRKTQKTWIFKKENHRSYWKAKCWACRGNSVCNKPVAQRAM